MRDANGRNRNPQQPLDLRRGNRSSWRISPTKVRARKRRLTEPTAAAQPWRREPLLMPHNRPCGRAEATARLAFGSDGQPGGRAYRALLSSQLTIDG